MIEKLLEIILLLPLGWMIFLGFSFFLRFTLPEKFLSEAVKWISSFLAFLCLIMVALVFYEFKSTKVDWPAWISISGYSFDFRFVVDKLGSIYALLSTCLVGIIFRFSRNYLHKEEGYFRFIFLLSTLLFGLLIVCFARALEFLFVGWELVGTTSILLIGYFYTNSQPVRHALRAMVSYRLCDMGILAAAAWAHHYLHDTDFISIPFSLHHAHGEHGVLFLIGLFVIWASLAKAGQLPFSSWLPAAMEGPTPSSAIFYGALSVHLGPFLLLRFYDYFVHFPTLLWFIGIIGGASSLYATLVGRTRSDAKTTLAYATISQVGLIWIEIALGFKGFALFHIVAHASLRTWQYLRSASLIHDFFENPVVLADKLIPRNLSIANYFSVAFKRRFFIHALNGFHLDYFTGKFISGFSFPFRILLAIETKMMVFNNRLVGIIFKVRNK